MAKPFLKWAGGKSQLLKELEKRLPPLIKKSKVIDCYVEPFVGGGAFFFYLKRYYVIKKSYLMDNNQDLILTYRVIKRQPAKLIKKLSFLENKYSKYDNVKRQDFYYDIRNKFNNQSRKFDFNKFSDEWINRASLLIFLNKTCFNGLFRQNNSGDFNVPHGRYKNPKICDVNNLNKVSKALCDTKIICGDFAKCKKYVISGSLVYFDPPYKPLNTTSSFTAYTKSGFCDKEQLRLAELCKECSKKNVYVLLSNSDPKNEDMSNNFFDEIYNGFNIQRVMANRMINCQGDKRGQIKELIITSR